MLKFDAGAFEKQASEAGAAPPVPALAVGTRLVPGHDDLHLCKPTDVAFVAAGGDFFVADGYCNARVLRYNAEGLLLSKFGSAGAGPGQFRLPHALAYSAGGGGGPRLYVADRMNKRV